jgi:hypothetical protein
MDWPTPEGLLFCWRHYLDILWCSDPSLTQKHECVHVHDINIYWYSKCIDDGMTQFSELLIFPSSNDL